jgi:hypothetical protein
MNVVSMRCKTKNPFDMDRTLLLSLSLAVCLPALAQPTLDYPANAPTPGTSFLTNYGEYTAPGASGASQTWNFANLVADSSSIVYVELPSATAQGSDFPNATAAVVGPDGTQYFQASSSVLELVGPSLLGQTVALTNPGSFLTYPCTYQSSWEDDFAGAVDVGLPVAITGNVIGIADGYGTLVLPEGTVNDVLRVRRVTTTTLDIPGIGGGELEDETYGFYRVGLGLPIMEISRTQGELPLLGPVDIQTLRWVDVNTVGIEDITSDAIGVEVFPNPATTNVQVNFGLAGGRTVAIELFDMHGRQVRTIAMNTGNSGVHTGNISVDGLSSGVYMLRITDNTGRVGTSRVQVL